jgi:hypothetical protein
LQTKIFILCMCFPLYLRCTVQPAPLLYSTCTSGGLDICPAHATANATKRLISFLIIGQSTSRFGGKPCCRKTMTSWLADPAELLVAEYAIAWGILFLLFRFAFLPSYSAKFANRLVSIVHPLVAVPLCFLATTSRPFTNFGQRTSASEARSVSFFWKQAV